MNATPDSSSNVTLDENDARLLALVGRRQIEWDPGAAARIVAAESAIACYTILPMDVMAVLATPARVDSGAIDRSPIVSFASFVIGLESALQGQSDVTFDMSTFPEVAAPVRPGLSLHELPPKDGWQMPIHGISRDVMPQVHEAVQEFSNRTPGMSARAAAEVAEEIWSRPAWAGLPVRVLHAARRLRMITEEPLRITASTCGPWKRLSTPRGQILTYTPGIEARLGLRVVR